MANHKSSEKRVRSDARKTVTNRIYMSRVKTYMKKLRTAIDTAKDASTVTDLFKTVQSTLAKAASKGIIRKNTVARNTSKFANAVKKIGTKTEAAATKTKTRTRTSKKTTTTK